MDNINLRVIRESFGRVVYSHKTHEKEAEIQSCYAKCSKWVNVILVTLTSSSLVGALVTTQKNYVIASAVCSALALAAVIFQLSFSPDEKAERHKQAANLLWFIRERYVNLMADIQNESITSAEIISRRDAVLRELDVVYKSAPATSPTAYKSARTALKIREELTFTDAEIDQFLPEGLKSHHSE